MRAVSLEAAQKALSPRIMCMPSLSVPLSPCPSGVLAAAISNCLCELAPSWTPSCLGAASRVFTQLRYCPTRKSQQLSRTPRLLIKLPSDSEPDLFWVLDTRFFFF